MWYHKFAGKNMTLTFKPVSILNQKNELTEFLLSNTWPYHVNKTLTLDKLSKMIDDGMFSGTNHESHFIFDNAELIGFIRLFDLDDIGDGYPLFDLRIKESARGKGVGKLALKWIAEYMFNKWPELERIAGTTRADNVGMRKTFLACGFAKEGHFRKDWEGEGGVLYDTVKYSLLRCDWESGTVTKVNWED
jgi:RimJ/RimL family protein N-acetyltransferase